MKDALAVATETNASSLIRLTKNYSKTIEIAAI